MPDTLRAFSINGVLERAPYAANLAFPKLIALFEEKGWKPCSALQGTARHGTGHSYTKVIIKLFHPELFVENDFRYITVNLVTTGHRRYPYAIHLGTWQRFAGVDSQFAFSAVKDGKLILPEVGFDEMVKEYIQKIPHFAGQIENKIKEWKTLNLNSVKQHELAKKAMVYRYRRTESFVNPSQILCNRAGVQNDASLWGTLNRVNVNLTVGGIRYAKHEMTEYKEGHRNKYMKTYRNSTREIANHGARFLFGQQLMKLAETTMQNIKEKELE